MGYLARLYEDFHDRADFLAVYIREAHPQDEWQLKPNLDEGVCYPQPKTLAQRVAIANDFIRRFHFPIPLEVDTMADAADRIYAAWPERIYILDPPGKIVYKGGIGPFGYHPEEARAWLERRFSVSRQSAVPSTRPDRPAD